MISEEATKTLGYLFSTSFTASGRTSEEMRWETNFRHMTNMASGIPLPTSLMPMLVVALGIPYPDVFLSDVGCASGELSSMCCVHPIPNVMLHREFLFICNFLKICNFNFFSKKNSLKQVLYFCEIMTFVLD